MFPRHVQELQVFYDAILMLSGYGQPGVGIDRNLLIPLQHLDPFMMALSFRHYTLDPYPYSVQTHKVRAYHLAPGGLPICTWDRTVGGRRGHGHAAWVPAATAEGAGGWRILFSFPLI